MTRSRLLLVCVIALAAPVAEACPWCRDSVRSAVATPEALPTAVLLWLPLLLVALVGAVLYTSDRS